MKSVISLFAVVFLYALSLHAFEVKSIAEISPTAFRKWDLTNGPIQIGLNQKGSDDVSLALLEDRTRHALQQWVSIRNVDVDFQYSGTESSATNTISWIEKDWPYGQSVLAVTKYTYVLSDTPYMVEADILFNGDDYEWAIDLAENYPRADYEQVLLHELGHFLGLSHSSVLQAALFPYLPSQVIHKISRDDKAGIAFLYAAPLSQLSAITPVKRARYIQNMATRGLPLPVFRWYAPPNADGHVLEFSRSTSFSSKISFVVNGRNYYELTAKDEAALHKMAHDSKLFWRVRSGSVISKVRSFRFKPID